MRSALGLMAGLLILATSGTALAARFSSSSVMNGVWLGMDIGYRSSKTETTFTTNAKTNGESTSSVYDIHLDYITIDQFYFGAVYELLSSSASGITSTNGSAAGATIGYAFSEGFDLGASYFFTANNGDYKEGTGYQVGLGWKAEVGRGFYLGAKINYREITYKKNETIALFTSLKTNDVYPMITLGFLF